MFGQLHRRITLESPRVEFDSSPPVRPVIAEVLTNGDRSFGFVVALAEGNSPSRIRVAARNGTTLFDASWPADRPPGLIDIAQLATEVEPAQRPRLFRQIMETAGMWLRLHDDPDFVRVCHRLAGSRAITPLPLRQAIDLSAKLLYLRLSAGALPDDVESVLLVGSGAVRRNAFRPRVMQTPAGKRELELVVERPDAIGPGTLDILLFGRREAARASIEPGEIAGLPALIPFLVGLGAPAADSRTFLLKTLKPYLASELPLAGVFEEALQTIRAPTSRARIVSAPVAAGIDLAVPTPDGGLFLAGWLSDPRQLVRGMEGVSPFGTTREIPLPRHRFSRPDIERDHALGERPPGQRTGFVAHTAGVKDPSNGGQYSIVLKLLSGAKIELIAPACAGTAAAARDQVLSSVPHPQLSPGMMAECIGPAASSLHRVHLAGKGVAEELRFGAERRSPIWSIVIPLYRDLDFLRFQLAAFAVDPDFRDAEIIFVLDSPEDRDRLERLLRSFLFVYDLPVRVLVHSGNFGYAPAVNTGAAVASGEWLVPLNSDVIPIDGLWLSRLRAATRREKRVGIAAPKLLFEDDSLQHAGLYYGRDLAGQWLNRHFYKGYPRDYSPANIARAVPGVTGACMLIERVLFERVGGLCEDYIIADYEDSDLSLRMLDAGRACWYEPAVELYHLERQSVVKHDGYMRSTVSEYNRSLHQSRWQGLMFEAMREFEGEGARAAPADMRPPAVAVPDIELPQ